jgi:hypothetical protein
MVVRSAAALTGTQADASILYDIPAELDQTVKDRPCT